MFRGTNTKIFKKFICLFVSGISVSHGLTPSSPARCLSFPRIFFFRPPISFLPFVDCEYLVARGMIRIKSESETNEMMNELNRAQDLIERIAMRANQSEFAMEGNGELFDQDYTVDTLLRAFVILGEFTGRTEFGQ